MDSAAKKLKTKTVKQIATFKASPHDLYEMIMDSKRHATFSGEKAKVSRRTGGVFSVYGGWVSGKNLKLKSDRLIIQAWRGKNWPKGHYSKAMFLFTKTKTGTRLTFRQTGVPVERYPDIAKGWKTQYWQKMKASLEKTKKANRST